MFNKEICDISLYCTPLQLAKLYTCHTVPTEKVKTKCTEAAPRRFYALKKLWCDISTQKKSRLHYSFLRNILTYKYGYNIFLNVNITTLCKKVEKRPHIYY